MKMKMKVVVLLALLWSPSCAEPSLAHLLAPAFVDSVGLEPLTDEQQVRGGFVGRHRLVARRGLAPQRIATIPWTACFGAREALAALPSDMAKGLSAAHSVMLGLMLAPPTWVTELEVNAPLVWDDKGLDLLRGTQVGSQVVERTEALRESYRAVVEPRLGNSQLGQHATFERWKWVAALMIALQYFPDKDPVLVPWVSLFSFGHGGNAHLHQTEAGALEILLNATVAEGEAIVLNDDLAAAAESSNARLFLTYGLLLGKRPFGFSVSLALDRHDPMFGNKREMFDKRFGGGRRVAARQDFVLDGVAVPSNLLFALRVYNCEVADGNELQKALLDERISERNEKDSWEQLGRLCLERLQGYPTTMETDKVLLGTQGLARNHKNAVLYRRGEKRVLLKTLAQVDAVARDLHNKMGVRTTDVLRKRDDNTFETVI